MRPLLDTIKEEVEVDEAQNNFLEKITTIQHQTINRLHQSQNTPLIKNEIMLLNLNRSHRGWFIKPKTEVTYDTATARKQIRVNSPRAGVL